MTHRIRSASLAGYIPLAEAAGLPVRQMLREAGIHPRSLADPETLINVRAVRQLLEASAERAGIEDFGLRLAASRTLSNLGPVSLALRDEPTGRQALETLCRHMRLVNESLFTQIEDAGDLVIIREEFLLSEPGTVRQSIELAVAVMVRLLRELLGPAWQPRQVCFAHRAPASRSSHQRMFGRTVIFNAEFNGIVCAARDLEQPIARADPGMAKLARRFLNDLRMQSDAHTADRVRQLILALLPSGRCTVDEVARHLGIDRRTIHRHLATRGETFSSVLSSIRADLATRHLTDSDRQAGDIAGLLGFAAPSAFARWFRQRFGTSAAVWRLGNATQRGPTGPNHLGRPMRHQRG
jgi:AraC-like DNA-binding protein